MKKYFLFFVLVIVVMFSIIAPQEVLAKAKKAPSVKVYKPTYNKNKTQAGWQVSLNSVVTARCGAIDTSWCKSSNLAKGNGVHGDGPYEIRWGDDNSEVTCANTANDHWYVRKGIYKITVTAKNTCGKTAKASTKVKVK